MEEPLSFCTEVVLNEEEELDEVILPLTLAYATDDLEEEDERLDSGSLESSLPLCTSVALDVEEKLKDVVFKLASPLPSPTTLFTS